MPNWMKGFEMSFSHIVMCICHYFFIFLDCLNFYFCFSFSDFNTFTQTNFISFFTFFFCLFSSNINILIYFSKLITQFTKMTENVNKQD